jgi:hypothetical protein
MTTTIDLATMTSASVHAPMAATGGGDAAAFMAAYNRHVPAQPTGAAAAPGANASSLLAPLSTLNAGSGSLADYANTIAGGRFSPSDVLELSLRTHEFVFRCQLTATVANRSGDGVQQLFRQQA